MNELILRTDKLTKRFKTVTVLDNVSITLERGRIYGLIGNNGAGKTTFMRILAGLSLPSSGTVSLFNQTTTRGLELARQRTGFLIDGAVGYDSLTPRQNLIAQSMLYGKVDEDYIDQLIDQVGLDAITARRTPYRVCSLGQKQRYAIAFALLNHPELLVLDEPVNGLDPAGMKEMLDLFLHLNQEENVTILISSHLLGHLYELASDFIFMDQGKIIAERTHSCLEKECGYPTDLEKYFFSLLQRKQGQV